MSGLNLGASDYARTSNFRVMFNGECHEEGRDQQSGNYTGPGQGGGMRSELLWDDMRSRQGDGMRGQTVREEREQRMQAAKYSVSTHDILTLIDNSFNSIKRYMSGDRDNNVKKQRNESV